MASIGCHLWCVIQTRQIGGEKLSVFVILYDPTQQICPIEASSAEEARKRIGERLGCDVSEWPIYNADSPEDLEIILSWALAQSPQSGQQ